MNRLLEIARTIENARPETSHNKILPSALAGESFMEGKLYRKVHVSN